MTFIPINIECINLKKYIILLFCGKKEKKMQLDST